MPIHDRSWRARLSLVTGAVLMAAAAIAAPPSVTEIYAFSDPAMGFRAVPGELTAGPGGVLYGFTSSGLTTSGTYLPGGLFELVPPTGGVGAWTSHVLLIAPHFQSFEAPLGGPLLIDPDGNLYGETTSDGPAFGGTIFEMSPPAAGATEWTFHTIFTVTNANQGAYLSGGLTLGPEGVLYGTAQAGGDAANGVVFSLTPPANAGEPWKHAVLWRFHGGTDGSVPYGAPALGAGGELYGVTGYGGAHGKGRVYMLTPPLAGETAWREVALHDFSGPSDGATPYASLTRDAAGTLFGIASTSGPGSYGTAFALIPPAGAMTHWKFELLHPFTGAPDGYSPEKPLVLQADGSLLGISMYGGNYPPSFDGVGAIFKLTPPAAGMNTWTEAVIFSFGDTDATIGELPVSGLTVSGSALYGTTIEGGAHSSGAAFRLVP